MKTFLKSAQPKSHPLKDACYIQKNTTQLLIPNPAKSSFCLPARPLLIPSLQSSSSHTSPRVPPATLGAMASPKYTNKKPPLTHFLCLPLLTPSSIPQLRASLSRFQQSASRPTVPEGPGSEGGDTDVSIPKPLIPEKAFRPLGVLHLTLGVMSLRSEEKVQAANHLLQSLNLAEFLTGPGEQSESSKPERESPDEPGRTLSTPESQPIEGAEQAPGILETLSRVVTPPPLPTPESSFAEPIVIFLQGLQAFPKPQKATVLHCPPYDPTSRLYSFCLKLRQKFVDAGFIQPENRPLVLHATIANTVYAKKDRRGEKRRIGSVTFDAREIMRRYNENGGFEAGEATGAFVWADSIVIDCVRICEMGAKKVDDDTLGQEYKAVAEKTI